MKITPHLVTETIMKMGPRDHVWRTSKMLGPIVHLISQSTLFDFTGIRPEGEHRAFALDLYQRGLFTLPFPITCFSFSGQNIADWSGRVHPTVNAMTLLAQETDGSLTAIQFAEQRMPDGRPGGAIPLSMARSMVFKDIDADKCTVSFDRGGAVPLVADWAMEMMFGVKPNVALDKMANRLAENAVGCMAMCVMLMSKGVDAVCESAPAKLNKARAAKGKPRIGDIYHVRINAGDVRRIHTDDGDESIAGHKRGSPRVRWRRGHFRCLNRGTDKEQVIPIAPMLVAANDRAEPIRQKIYKVTG